MLLLYASLVAGAMSAMSDSDKLDLVADHVSGRSEMRRLSVPPPPAMRTDSETLDLILDLICRGGSGAGGGVETPDPTTDPTPAPSPLPTPPPTEAGGVDIDDWEPGFFHSNRENRIEMQGDIMRFTRNVVAINSGLGEITAPFSFFAQIKNEQAGSAGGARLIFGSGRKCDRDGNPKSPRGFPCEPGAFRPAVDLHVGGWGRDRGTQAYQVTGQDTICFVNGGNHQHVFGACNDPDWPLMNGDYFWMGISLNEQGEIKVFVGDNGEDLDTVKSSRLFHEDLLPGVAGRPQSRYREYHFSLSGYVWLSAAASPLLVKSFVYEPNFQTQSGQASRELGSSRMEFLPARAMSMGDEANPQIAQERRVDWSGYYKPKPKECRQLIDEALSAERGLTHGTPFVWFGLFMVAGFAGGYAVASRKKVVTDESSTLLGAA